MKLSELMETENLNSDAVKQGLDQLNLGMSNFSKKILSNPMLAQYLGKDTQNLGKMSTELQKRFLELKKQKQIEEINNLKKKQEESKKQQSLMANGMNGVRETNYSAPETANN